MRIIFMGTPEFAVASLDILLAGDYNVVAVVTAPDKPAGRGQQLNESAVKKYAIKHGLKVLQPEKLKDPVFLSELTALKADLQVVVAFRMLPEMVWNMPKAGTYNLHASLLPKYRGAAPINWAIINGDHISGVTTFKLKQEIDTGNILYQEKVAISDTDTAGNLHDTLMKVGANLVLKTVQTIHKSFISGEELDFISQDNDQSSHAPKIFKDTCRIDWNTDGSRIHNLVRGLSPYPTAFTYIQNGEGNTQSVKIFHSKFEIAAHKQPNGLISTDNKFFLKVYCTRGFFEITELQLEGKKRMSVADFLKGYKINPGAAFV